MNDLKITPEMEAAALALVEDCGPVENVWHLDYGWIVRNGDLTEAGIEFYVREIAT
jgi:hypothetical protein